MATRNPFAPLSDPPLVNRSVNLSSSAVTPDPSQSLIPTTGASTVVQSGSSPLVDVAMSPLSSPITTPPQICSKSSIPAWVPQANAPSYAERFKSPLRNLRKISSPTYEEDGIPIVQAPKSVLL